LLGHALFGAIHVSGSSGSNEQYQQSHEVGSPNDRQDEAHGALVEVAGAALLLQGHSLWILSNRGRLF
jgi:hypothetical protein